MRADLPGRRDLCVQGEHHIVDAGEAALTLLDDLWFEGAGLVVRDVHLDRGGVLREFGLSLDPPRR
jgi:hypothetical protein